MSLLNKNKGIIFTIIFSILCITTTTILIYLTNNGMLSFRKSNNKDKLDVKDAVVADGLGIKSLKDTYLPNGLDLEEVKLHYGEEDEYESYPVEISYFKISGLKDKSVEDKINEDIKKRVMALYNPDEMEDEKVESISISTTSQANFSNVLSFWVIKQVYFKNEDDDISEINLGLNYNLKTGEEIKFTDLFTNDAGTKNIIFQSAYLSFASEYLGDYSDEFDGDMSKIDYSSIEDRALKVMQKYNRDEDYEFWFDERSIHVIINNEFITINMRDFYSQIAIYNRYADYEDLFTANDNNKIIVFALNKSAGDLTVYRRVEECDDNLFIDAEIIDGTIGEEEYEIDYNEYIEDIEEKINESKKYLEQHPDKAVVIACLRDINDADGTLSTDSYTTIAYMTKDYYTKTFLNHILEREQITPHQVDLLSITLPFVLREERESYPNIEFHVEFPEGYEI